MKALDPPVTPVRLAEIFRPEATLIKLEHRDKPGIIAGLVHRLVEVGHIAPAAEAPLVQLILAREKMGSTAIGKGIASPHCPSNLIDTFVGAVAVDADGVPFDALDNGLVYIIFLLIGPAHSRQQQFEVLGRIHSLGWHRIVQTQLRGCQSAEAVHRVLRQFDRDWA